MREKPKPQELYRHFKGNLYQVITVATDTETDEEIVVYQALYGDFRIWSRPLSSFMAEVDRDKYPDADAKYRFSRVEASRTSSAVSAEPAVPKPPREEKRADSAVQSMVFSPDGGTRSERVSGVMSKTIEEEADELGMDPLVVAFLDADGATGRIRVLEKLRGKVTDDMIDIMAVSAGVEVEPGDIWDRYNELMSCLRTIERFETNRLR